MEQKDVTWNGKILCLCYVTQFWNTKLFLNDATLPFDRLFYSSFRYHFLMLSVLYRPFCTTDDIWHQHINRFFSPCHTHSAFNHLIIINMKQTIFSSYSTWIDAFRCHFSASFLASLFTLDVLCSLRFDLCLHSLFHPSKKKWQRRDLILRPLS